MGYIVISGILKKQDFYKELDKVDKLKIEGWVLSDRNRSEDCDTGFIRYRYVLQEPSELII